MTFACIFSYDICIRGEEGYCCVEYMPCADANSYTLDTLAIAAMSKVGTDCTADYIEIPGKSYQFCVFLSSMTMSISISIRFSIDF